MKNKPSILYNGQIPQVELHLYNAIERGLAGGSGFASVFFRADDIGVPSKMFEAMVSLFRKYQMPLCLATVPAWLTETRRDVLVQMTGGSPLFCWHQHGWIHRNHEVTGKKYEFGNSRSAMQLADDISGGKERLEKLLGDSFFPVFTPPWNRCNQMTLNILEDLQFKAISRSSGATPPVSASFPDYQVNVDLHTRKETDEQESFEKLCSELQLSISSGRAGIMLHHQLMNTHALDLLENLLQIIFQIKNLQVSHFKDLSQ